MFTSDDRIQRLSLTAAITQSGSLYYCMHKGTNNSETTQLFLSQLFKLFDNEDQGWKKKKIFVADFCSYHCSKSTREWILAHNVKFAYAGVYGFQL